MNDFLPGFRHETTVVSSGAIGAVDVATTAFVGVTEKGPVATPTSLNSFSEFVSLFGSFGVSDMAFCVKDFFDNGGQTAVILRLAHYTDVSDASTIAGVKADLATDIKSVSGESALNFNALYEGVYGNDYNISTSSESLFTGSISETTLAGADTIVLDGKAGVSPKSVLDIYFGADVAVETLEGAILKANMYKSAFNAHIVDLSAHDATGAVDAITAGDAVDQDTLTTLLIDARSSTLNHFAQGPMIHAEIDLTSVVTAPAPNGADSEADQLQDSIALVNEIVTSYTSHLSQEENGNTVHTTNDETNLVETIESVKVVSIDTTLVSGSLVHTATLESALVSNATAGAIVTSKEFNVTLRKNNESGVVETFSGLSMETDSSNYVVTRLSDNVTGSSYIEATVSSSATLSARLPVDTDRASLQGGLDPDSAGIEVSDIIGDESASTGVRALDSNEDVRLVAIIPDNVSSAFYTNELAFGLQSWAEATRDKMVLLEVDPVLTGAQKVAFVESNGIDSGYVSYFTPKINVVDVRDRTGNTVRSISPLAAVAGKFAYVDNLDNSGPHRSAAGDAPYGDIGTAISVSDKYSKYIMSEMNRVGLNVIRPIKDKGVLIYGARTQSSESEYKYINAVRNLMFLQASIEQGSSWLIFANNNRDTWTQGTDSIRTFLNGVWTAGGLKGSSPSEAFFVRIGESSGVQTTSETESGIMNVVVGVANQTPAEFVIFKWELNKSGFTLV